MTRKTAENGRRAGRPVFAQRPDCRYPDQSGSGHYRKGAIDGTGFDSNGKLDLGSQGQEQLDALVATKDSSSTQPPASPQQRLREGGRAKLKGG